jgi:type I site-specific restriction endonuclease
MASTPPTRPEPPRRETRRLSQTAREESEARTRRERVDPKLKEEGWTVVPFDGNRPPIRYTHHAVTEFPTANGPADYGLLVNGQALGIVEANGTYPMNIATGASIVRFASMP